jgi:hypothetical protein
MTRQAPQRDERGRKSLALQVRPHSSPPRGKVVGIISHEGGYEEECHLLKFENKDKCTGKKFQCLILRYFRFKWPLLKPLNDQKIRYYSLSLVPVSDDNASVASLTVDWINNVIGPGYFVRWKVKQSV